MCPGVIWINITCSLFYSCFPCVRGLWPYVHAIILLVQYMLEIDKEVLEILFVCLEFFVPLEKIPLI